jgi:hypothetical protein
MLKIGFFFFSFHFFLVKYIYYCSKFLIIGLRLCIFVLNVVWVVLLDVVISGIV